jgi:hypothetical protein
MITAKHSFGAVANFGRGKMAFGHVIHIHKIFISKVPSWGLMVSLFSDFKYFSREAKFLFAILKRFYNSIPVVIYSILPLLGVVILAFPMPICHSVRNDESRAGPMLAKCKIPTDGE